MSKQTQEARRRVHGLLVDEERLEPGISSLQFALDLDLDLAQQTLPRLGILPRLSLRTRRGIERGAGQPNSFDLFIN